MIKSMRDSTLLTLGLGSVFDVFRKGGLPVSAGDLADQVFGSSSERGSLVISGVCGIVGAGKAMQLGSRLEPYGVPVVGLDFPGAPDGVSGQYPGLERAFGAVGAARIMSNFIRLSYDGRRLPPLLGELRPRFLLEAVPELLEVKQAHYELFRRSFPGIEIRSVTSGFPSSELGVGVAHPAFPHEINKIWEIVEESPTPVTQLLWALGMVPVPVSDDWSFVLDVLFCGITLAGLRYHQATNMPFWKVDKFIRKLVGPNPFRAHDAIGAKGANFLTWSCLHHLSRRYGDLFKPTPALEERKASGQNWYPPNHFRPLVDWSMGPDEEEDFLSWIQGPYFQMAGLLLHEKRAHLSHANSIGELCAQFRRGAIAEVRRAGCDAAIKRVEAYHRLHPGAAAGAWHPEAFEQVEGPEGRQLYVNAEHDGSTGVISISRESYNGDVDAELNRAIDWLKAGGVDSLILTGDFHLSTQMVGADTSEFFPALEDRDAGYEIAAGWSKTARRLHDEFRVSVGCVGGKRCLGGFLELMLHCHCLVAVEDARLGMPEVTLPVVPGMEGCHWPFRKTGPDGWPRLIQLLLGGRTVAAAEAVGWLVDYAGPLEESIRTAWSVATGGEHGLRRRDFESGGLRDIAAALSRSDSTGRAMETAVEAIAESIRRSCEAKASEALEIQARLSADFMVSRACREGIIGAECARVMNV